MGGGWEDSGGKQAFHRRVWGLGGPWEVLRELEGEWDPQGTEGASRVCRGLVGLGGEGWCWQEEGLAGPVGA